MSDKTKNEKMTGIRPATLEDAQDILEIYEPYILNTTITYEFDKIPLEDFKLRMESIMKKHPYLVYEVEGEIAGYAYASPHLERAAFAWDCEVTVYLSPKFQGHGIASKLYEVLLAIVEKQGYKNVYSLIDYPNDASYALHKKFGFTELGTYKNTAYKFGAWRHLQVLEKRFGDLSEPKKINDDWHSIQIEGLK